MSNGLTAFETLLGWTISGKVPVSKHQDSTHTIVSIFTCEANISELWNLDVLGIRDPIEKLNRLLKEQTIKDNFLKTVYFNEKGRYSVNLPWIEDHAPIPSNFDLATRRLETTVKIKKIIIYTMITTMYLWNGVKMM